MVCVPNVKGHTVLCVQALIVVMVASSHLCYTRAIALIRAPPTRIKLELAETLHRLNASSEYQLQLNYTANSA